MPTVYVNSTPVGTLARGATRDEHGRVVRAPHEFRYEKGVSHLDAVSLLMPTPEGEPVTYPAAAANVLHPVFDQNLPEGVLRAAIERMFSKVLPIFDDFALLEIVGRSLLGRLQFSNSDPGKDLPSVPAQNLKGLLQEKGTVLLFKELLERYAVNSGISGVQPKLLLRDDGSLMTSKLSPPLDRASRITASSTTHIVKGFVSREYPDLAANEYACMRAADFAGLDVPPIELAEDGGLLAIERFDLRPQGGYWGFEDMCSLAGLGSIGKYEGSYEQIAKTLKAHIRSPEGVSKDLRDFFKSLVLSIVVRNGDAHRKNFGVLYPGADGVSVRLAPAYDIVTTVVYIKHDSLALMLGGTKRWPNAKNLRMFGVNQCGLIPSDAQAVIDEVCSGVERAKECLERIQDAQVREGMAAAWEQGLLSMRTMQVKAVASQSTGTLPKEVPVPQTPTMTDGDVPKQTP